MTNGDWIRSMTDDELEKNVINPCSSYECGNCPMRYKRGVCVAESSRTIALEWLESEHEK